MNRSSGLSLAAAAGMLLFGLSTALLGAILPVLSARLDFSLAQSGTLFLVLNFGVFLCVFGLGRWIDQRGMKLPMVAGPALVAAALYLVTVAQDFRVLLLAALVLGLGGGALNVATNTLVADRYPEARQKNSALNWLGIFFGLGGLLIPVGVGALLSRVGIDPILRVAAFLCVAVSVLTSALNFPPPKHPAQALPRRIERRGVLALTAALLFFQSGNEIILSGYAATFLVQQLSLPLEVASWGLTLMWVAVILARLVLMRLALRFSGHRIVLASGAAMLAGSALLLAARSPASAFAALCLTGAGMAGVFPTVLGMTGALWRESSGTVFGLLLTVSRTGAMALPFAAGHFSGQFGIRSAIWMVLASAALTFLLEQVRWGRLSACPAASKED